MRQRPQHPVERRHIVPLPSKLVSRAKQMFVAARDGNLTIQNRQRLCVAPGTKEKIDRLPQRHGPGSDRLRRARSRPPSQDSRFGSRDQTGGFAPGQQVFITAQPVANHDATDAPAYGVHKIQAHPPADEFPYGKLHRFIHGVC